MVAPIVVGVAFMAVYASGGIGLLAHGWTVAHWREVLASPGTWLSIGYSFAVGLVSLAVSIAAALAILGLGGARVGRGPAAIGWFVPLTMPPMVAALVTLEFWGGTGLVARIVHALGWIAQPSDFPPIVFSGWGVGIILTHAMLVTPFLVLLFARLDGLLRLDDLVLTARTLGASRFSAWVRVRVPALLRAAEPALTVYAIVLIGAFEVPLLLGAQSPSMISVAIERHFTEFDLMSQPAGYALATLYAVVAMLVLLVWFIWRYRGVHVGKTA
ncbi:MAG: hypothetical protein EPN40_03955 [Rhodanobacteraceae bacterium]|nr:MAG: hypothetical protein EPN40_03955 [Rhodanobacteraceae bacterium]